MRRLTAQGRRIRRVREHRPPERGRLLLLWLGPPDEEAWVACLVSRRVGKAHDRNRVRRRLREIVRRSLLDRPLVVSARPHSRVASYQELSDELERLLAAALARADGDSSHLGVSAGDLPVGRPVVSV